MTAIWVRAVLAALGGVLLAGLMTDRGEARTKVNSRVKEIKEARAATDSRFAAALSAGKAIVVIPLAETDERYFGEKRDGNVSLWEAYSDQSSASIWRRKDKPGSVIITGRSKTYPEPEYHRTEASFSDGRVFYAMYILDPGTYSYAGDRHDLYEIDVPNARGGTSSLPSGLGQVTFTMAKRDAYVTKDGVEWQDGKTETVRNPYQYCRLETIGGPCIQWETGVDSHQRVTEWPGWVNVRKTEKKQIDALVMNTNLTHDFASFTVAPGEVVLTDGLFASFQNVNVNPATCRTDDVAKIRCNVAGYAAVLIKGSVEGLQQALRKPDGFTILTTAVETMPKMSKILETTQYRALQITARASGSKSWAGPIYTLSVGK